MIILLLSHIIITGICLWSGYIFNHYFLKNGTKQLIFYLINGLILITLVSQVAALFIPVNFYFLAAMLAMLALIAFLKKDHFSRFCQLILNEISSLPLHAKLSVALLWGMILLINAGPVLMDDTGSYHIQMIKWIQEYGSVPGIANLHERYGFNTSWFTSVAFFSPFSSQVNLFTALNGALSIWFCYYAVSASTMLFKQNNSQGAVALFVVLMVTLLVWPMTRGSASNTNYDFITTLLVLILSIEILVKHDGHSMEAEWILWPAYLFTVRIINFPLLLFSLVGIYFIMKKGSLKNLLLPIVFSLLLILPFLAKNLVASGYMFYPALYFDFFNVDWKADPGKTKALLEFIKYYNRVNTTFLDIEQTKALGTPGWIPVWFHHLYLYDKIILLPGITGLLIEIINLVKKKFQTAPLLIVFIIIAFCSIFSWFVISPDPRFIYGLLLAGVYLLAFRILNMIPRVNNPGKTMAVFFMLLISGTGLYIVKKLIREPAQHNWMSPVQLPQPPVKEVIVDGLIFRIPGKINTNWNERCYATPLPCLYEVDPKLRARGNNYSHGFRLEK